MKEKYLVIGTAGHVDHGKTQLIKALTGTNTDRLKEEKKRGISIELGFAYLTLPDGRKVGIVDVPGHEKFVRQMLAGASGMNIVLLIVAADEGVMPQTQEHLDILNLLQLEKGIVVLTKIDLVELEWLKLVEQDTKDKLRNSFLENAPICKVSSVTGEGLPELLETIIKVLDKTEAKRTDLPARMPIDRVFTKQGFGTIVTGTLVSGLLRKGQDIKFEPGGLNAKIRNIQVHGSQVFEAVAGQRTAINLSGLAVNDIQRGTTLVEPGSYRAGQILDLELTNLANEKRVIKQRQRIHFHLGTAEKTGRIHLINREELAPGETGFAQVILDSPILAVVGDRFVIRYYSPVVTIGGGKVLGVSSVKKKRFKDKVLEEFRVRAEGSSRELIIRELQNPVPIRMIMDKTALAKEQVEQELKNLREEALIVILQEDDLKVYWLREAAQRWGKLVSAEAARFQRLYPLRGGIGREELKKKLAMDLPLKTWQLLLDWGSENNFFRIVGNNVEALPEIKLPQKIQEQLECLHSQWERAGLNPPDWQESTNVCGIALNKFQEFAAYLLTKGLWIRIGDYYFASTVIEKAQVDLVKLLEKKGQVTVAEVRDYWQTSRKYALPLLEYFDSINLTKRDGVNRSLYK